MLRLFFLDQCIKRSFQLILKLEIDLRVYWDFSYRFFDINDHILNCLLKLLKLKANFKANEYLRPIVFVCFVYMFFFVLLCCVVLCAASIHFRHNFQLELLIMSAKHSYTHHKSSRSHIQSLIHERHI